MQVRLLGQGKFWATAAWIVALFAAPALAEPPPLSLYGRLPGFEMASITQSGDHIAVLATVDGARNVLVMDTERHLIARVPIEDKMKVRGLSWVGDQSLLIDFTATVALGVGFTKDKAELGSVIVVPLDHSKGWQVFRNDYDITGGVWSSYGMVQRDGRWYGYFGGVTLEKSTAVSEGRLPNGRLHPDLYEVDMQTQHHHIIAPRTDGDAHRHWLVDGTGSVGARLDLMDKSGAWGITNAHGVKIASGTDLLGDVGLIGFTADGTGVIYRVRNRKTLSDDWLMVPLDGGPSTPFPLEAPVRQYFLDSGHRLLGYSLDIADNGSHFADPRKQKIFNAVQKAFPGERTIFEDANGAFDRLLVRTEGSGDSETWWVINIATGKADIVGTSYPMEPEQVGPMRMFPYAAADGLKMEGVLTLPPGRPAKGLPAVMLPHGGPTAHDELKFDWMAQALASRGYAVLQPNFRGSTGYGVDFELAGHNEWGRKMQTDISDGLAELVHQGIVDPKRVCIMGASYGGYAALAGVTLQQGIYRCAVADAGVSDVARMVADDVYGSGGNDMMIRWLKDEIGKGKDLKDISPIHYADKVQVPVLLIHGKDDTVVAYSQSANMADALRHAGKQVEFVTMKDEDHWLSRSETREQMLQASVDFIMRNNPPDPAPAVAPAKP